MMSSASLNKESILLLLGGRCYTQMDRTKLQKFTEQDAPGGCIERSDETL